MPRTARECARWLAGWLAGCLAGWQADGLTGQLLTDWLAAGILVDKRPRFDGAAASPWCLTLSCPHSLPVLASTMHQSCPIALFTYLTFAAGAQRP